MEEHVEAICGLMDDVLLHAVWRKQGCRIAGYLGNRACITADHRGSTGHSLNHRHPKTIVAGGKPDKLRGVIERHQRLLILIPTKNEGRLERTCAIKVSRVGVVNDDERQVGLPAMDVWPCIEDQFSILSVVETAGDKNVRPVRN